MIKNPISHDEINGLWQSCDERLVSRHQAAAMLDVDPETLANGLKVANPPRVFKVGRLAKYQVGDIRRFVSEIAA